MTNSPNYLMDGEIIREGHTLDPNGPEWYFLARITDDETRRVITYHLDEIEPEQSEVLGLWYRDNVMPENAVGCIAFRVKEFQPSLDDVKTGLYISYSRIDEPAELIRFPVNQIPFLFVWWEHLSKIADDFVSSSHTDIFLMEDRDVGFSPTDVTYTTSERQSFEYVTGIVRRCVGLLMNRIETYSEINAKQIDDWKSLTHTLSVLVNKLCESCSGRGWKHRLLTRIDLNSWRDDGLLATNRSSTFFPKEIDNGSWIAGDFFPDILEIELGLYLLGWRNALNYHRDTDGTEAKLYFDAPLPIIPTTEE